MGKPMRPDGGTASGALDDPAANCIDSRLDAVLPSEVLRTFDGGGRPLDDPAANCVDSRLDAVVDLQLHQDVRDVVLARLRADVELTGDHRVVLAVGDQL